MKVALCGAEKLAEIMVEDIKRHRQAGLPSPVRLLSANGHALSLYARDDQFARAMDAAEIVHADGQSIVFLSRLLPGPSIESRSATTDFLQISARSVERLGGSFYILGGSEDVNRRCVEKLSRLFPRLKIVGARHGYFSRDEESEILEEIRDTRPDVIWVGLGKPKEQKFIHRNFENLDAAWIVSCGGCFDFFVGDYSRAPRWMQKAGLEWFHRMATGPRYLMKRYLFTNAHAIWLGIRNANDY